MLEQKDNFLEAWRNCNSREKGFGDTRWRESGILPEYLSRGFSGSTYTFKRICTFPGYSSTEVSIINPSSICAVSFAYSISPAPLALSWFTWGNTADRELCCWVAVRCVFFSAVRCKTFDGESCRVVYDSLSSLSEIAVCVRAEAVNKKRTVVVMSEKKGASFLNERLFVFREGFQQKAMDSSCRGKLK